MRDLSAINKGIKSTHSLFLISLILPAAIGILCWAISGGPTEDDNYLALSGIAISVIALIAIPVSYLFRWDWRTYCYGTSVFGIASVACFGIYPILYIAIHSLLPLGVRVILVCVEIFAIFLWCARFVRVYAKIYENKYLFDKIYTEEQGVFYFFLQKDKQVLEGELKFFSFPKGRYFVAPVAVGIIVFFYGDEITRLLGIPFTHLFWAVVTAPFPAAFLGIATKMWLVCYEYPRRIEKNTGKLTYVDMVSKGNAIAS